jgi:hypothetical protein
VHLGTFEVLGLLSITASTVHAVQTSIHQVTPTYLSLLSHQQQIICCKCKASHPRERAHNQPSQLQVLLDE